MNKKTRNIVLICDDNYVMPTLVTIRSIDSCLEKDDFNYVVHICCFNLNQDNMDIIHNSRFENVTVVVDAVDEEKYKKKFSLINQHTHVTATSLLKFELANIYHDINIMLYLDSDLIIKKNIAPIFDIDLTGKYLAATFELWNYLVKHYQYHSDDDTCDFYFNSGVMLLNLEEFRINNLPAGLWETKLNSFNAEINHNTKNLMDQDALNDICSSNCVALPIIYNCDTKYTVEVNLSLLNRVFDTNYHSHKELYEDVIVLHYIGKTEKPWKYEDVCRQKDWDEIYSLTLYSDTALNRIKIHKGIIYVIRKVAESIQYRGLINTIKYIIDIKFYSRD